MKILETFKAKNNESFYLPMYVKLYIEHKKELTGKSMGEVLEDTITKSPDFKEVMNDFFESVKIDE